MSILIQTHYGDFHGLAVHWALKELQVPALLWEISEFPARASWSSRFGGNGRPSSIFRQDGQDAVDLSGEVRVVWNRRVGRPALSDDIPDADRNFLKREVEHFLRGARNCVGDRAIWLNSNTAADRLEGKACQLSLALQCGLLIPDTLMSNDPAAIEAFVTEHQAAIYKPFRVPVWYQEGSPGLSVTMTTRIDPETIRRGDEVLKWGPGIFQEQILKAYEVRVTAFGGEFHVAEIHAQGGRVDDWRSDFRTTRVRRGEISDALKHKLTRFMELADLRFGCFDLIVDPDGREIFLEVNQMGQFLWVEHADSSLRLLDAFARHLCRLADFEPMEPATPITLEGYMRSAAHSVFERDLDGSKLASNMDVGMPE